MFEILPSQVLYPKNKEDVKAAIDNANKEGITIHARGCGTATAGQSLGSGISIDFSRYMKDILNIGDNYVDVEPGIVLGKLNEELKPLGLFMPVEPSSADFCSVGGMVANNASGIHSYMYGDTKDYVIGLEGYFADGSFFSTTTGVGTEKYITHLSTLKLEAVKLFDKVPKAVKDSSGYNIKDAFSLSGLDALNSLIVGSEGTLCVITKIRLKIISLPEKRITVLALFDDFEKALDAVSLSRSIQNVSAIELLDKELIETSKKNFVEIREYFGEDIHAGLIFEIDGSLENTKSALSELEKVLSYIAVKVETGYDEEKRKKLWWMRKSATSILSRIEGSHRTLRFIEDIAVSFENITEFYREEKKILDSYNLPTAFFGHIGCGHFHINPKIDTRRSDFMDVIDAVSEKTYALVKRLNGTIAGEHGDGLLRAPYIKMFNPELHSFFVKIKTVFDPKMILNPDKIVSIKDTVSVNNRYVFTPIYNIGTTTLNEIEKCDGCNDCLNFCTSFEKSDHDEGTKARGRANLLRAIVSGLIGKNELKEAIDYIEGCKLCTKCANQCPIGIDIIKISATLREAGILPISFRKKLLMFLMLPVKHYLESKVKHLNTNTELALGLLTTKVIKLGLYYRPYLANFFEAVSKKHIKIKSVDKNIETYLSKF